MSIENQVSEEEKPVQTEVAGAKEGEEVQQETEDRECVMWPGVTGEGELAMHFFDIKGIPEGVDDESDGTLKLLMALMAEVQQLRVENYELKQAVTYMSMEHFMKQKGHGPSPFRPPPMGMQNLVSKA